MFLVGLKHGCHIIEYYIQYNYWQYTYCYIRLGILFHMCIYIYIHIIISMYMYIIYINGINVYCYECLKKKRCLLGDTWYFSIHFGDQVPWRKRTSMWPAPLPPSAASSRSRRWRRSIWRSRRLGAVLSGFFGTVLLQGNTSIKMISKSSMNWPLP